MSDERDWPEGEEVDTGEPIPELALLREEPGGSFLHLIRNSINRRVFAGEVLSFSFLAFFELIFDYFKMIMQLFGVTVEKGGESSDG